MAWTLPMTAVTNATLTAAQWNASVRDNLAETAVAKATTSGSYFVGTGTNSMAQRIPQMDAISTSETTTSASYTDLTTIGPTVTVTSGTNALVLITSNMSSNTANIGCFVGLDISGSTTLAASDSRAIIHTSATANAALCASMVALYSVTAGSNAYTLKYRTSSGTATFQYRRVNVLPF